MANRVKVAKALAIQGLWRQGFSYRRIASMMGVRRETVRRYVEEERAKPSSPTLGSGTVPSECEPFRDVILAKLEEPQSERAWPFSESKHSSKALWGGVRSGASAERVVN